MHKDDFPFSLLPHGYRLSVVYDFMSLGALQAPDKHKTAQTLLCSNPLPSVDAVVRARHP